MKLSKTVVISLVAAIVIAGGGIFYLQSSKDKQPNTAQNTKNETIADNKKPESGEDPDYKIGANGLRDDLPLYPRVKHEPEV